jgi:glutathione S-transferase
VIRLVQFPPHFGLPNPSPFCMRVETFLRLARLPYEVVTQGNPRTAPKGKLPYIIDDGEQVTDSQFIVDHLTAKYAVLLDRSLTGEERALATALTRLLCEHFYWCSVYYRFVDDEGWAGFREWFTSNLPPVVGAGVTRFIRHTMRREAHAAGMGRHSRHEVAEIARRDLDALAVCLGAKDFFFGNEPTSFDATAFAFLANTLHGPGRLADETGMRSMANLTAFSDRMWDRCFPGMKPGGSAT